MRVEKAMARYLHIYQALYARTPRELRDLGNDWVLVNGARMTVDELESLTEELNREYQQVITNRRGIVKRLLTWFAKA
ncbi:MAG: hypothetical protein GXY36_08705 [Chloroflexi bacterium]|nr:hypothetical protein [Chloroflexota bacterium]